MIQLEAIVKEIFKKVSKAVVKEIPKIIAEQAPEEIFKKLPNQFSTALLKECPQELVMGFPIAITRRISKINTEEIFKLI